MYPIVPVVVLKDKRMSRSRKLEIGVYEVGDIIVFFINIFVVKYSFKLT